MEILREIIVQIWLVSVNYLLLLRHCTQARDSAVDNDLKNWKLSYEITHFRVNSDNLHKNVVEQLKTKNAEMNEIHDKCCKEWESATCIKFRKMCDNEYDKIEKNKWLSIGGMWNNKNNNTTVIASQGA